jgi:hypothetical protein
VEDQNEGRAEERLLVGNLSDRISILVASERPAKCLARPNARVLVMGANNEHIALRRRMEQRLGRSVSQPAWDLATEQGFEEEALDPVYGPDREDGLFGFLTALLRLEDGGLAARSKRSRLARPSSRPTPDLSARIEAVSRLAAEHAAGDEEILHFRQRVLGRDAPMSAAEAEAYLELPEARGILWASGPAEVLKYQNRHVGHDLHVWAGSPLDELRKLADSLTKSYPWEPAQAAAFVLEGLIPLATPFMLRFPQTWDETRPTRARLVMEVDLWMPASAVLRAYRDVQRSVLPGHNRPVSDRSLDLVNFVMLHLPATWQKLLDQWNTEHPKATYPDYRRLQFAFKRARSSLLFTTYRPYAGPGEQRDKVP